MWNNAERREESILTRQSYCSTWYMINGRMTNCTNEVVIASERSERGNLVRISYSDEIAASALPPRNDTPSLMDVQFGMRPNSDVASVPNPIKHRYSHTTRLCHTGPRAGHEPKATDEVIHRFSKIYGHRAERSDTLDQVRGRLWIKSGMTVRERSG